MTAPVQKRQICFNFSAGFVDAECSKIKKNRKKLYDHDQI